MPSSQADGAPTAVDQSAVPAGEVVKEDVVKEDVVKDAVVKEDVAKEDVVKEDVVKDDWRMSARIAELAKRVEHERDLASAHLELSVQLYASSRFTESRDQIDWSLREASECLRIEPRAHPCALARARAEIALALFDRARADALYAREGGADDVEVTLVLAEVDWAEGKYAEATNAIRTIAEQQPTPEHMVRRAQLEDDLGHYPFAEHLLTRAAEALGDADPARQAWIGALRGAHCRRVGRLQAAELMLRRALTRAPGLPFALAELARTLTARQDTREATRVYRQLIATTNDPEYIGELASLQRARGNAEQADALDGEARRLFEEGLAHYPEALRLPAARFYLAEERDVARALALLAGGGARFRSSDELEMAARAHLAAGRLADAEEAIHGALALAPVSLQVLRTAETTYRMLAELTQP
ncbi:MAG TPA: hypothetical protein VI299_08790 [Polyangiales bacterium]